MRKGFFVITAVTLLHACNNGTATEGSKKGPVKSDSVSAPAAAETGNVPREVYSGTMSCVDCDSIQTVLYLNADSTFEKRTTYSGVRDSTFSMAPEKGRWTLVADTLVLLETNAPNKFIRRDSVLLQLDLMGLPVIDKKADTLALKRVQ